MKKIIYLTILIIILIGTCLVVIFLIRNGGIFQQKTLQNAQQKAIPATHEEDKPSYGGQIAFNYDGELSSFIIKNPEGKRSGIDSSVELKEIENTEIESHDEPTEKAGHILLNKPAAGKYSIILNGERGKFILITVASFLIDNEELVGGNEFGNEIFLTNQPIIINCQISENDITIEPPLTQPKNFTAKKTSKNNQNHIELTWSVDDTKDIAGFNIFSRKEISDDGSNFPDFVLEGKVDASATSYVLDDIWDKSGKTYTMNAFSNDGRESFIAPFAFGNTTTIADFSATPTEGKLPLTVQFKDESFNDVTSWNWDFGDNSTSTEKNPVHTYQKTGKYYVTLIVKGGGGEDLQLEPDYISVTD